MTTVSGERPDEQPPAAPPATATPPAFALELLVHGVGGATPERLLGDAHTVRTAGDSTAGVHRRARDADAEDHPERYRDRPLTEAYCWSNLTSGTAARALWLLLLPFLAVNLAHWMRPASVSRPARGYELLVRLTALTLTVLLVATAGEVALDLLAWECAGSPRCAGDRPWLAPFSVTHPGWWTTPGRRLALAAVVPLALTGLLWWLSHRTWNAYESQRPPFPGAPRPSGASTATPTDRPALAGPGFWYGRRPVARLRAAHTAAGFVTVAALVLTPALRHDRAGGPLLLRCLGWTLVGLLAALTATVVLVVHRSSRQEDTPDEVVDGLGVTWLPSFALGGAVLTLLYAAVPGRGGWTSTGRLPTQGLFLGLALAQGCLVLLLALAAHRLHRPPERERPAAAVLRGQGGPAVAVLACGLGGLLSAGSATWVADWLDRGHTPATSEGPLAGPPPVLLWQAAIIPGLLAAVAGLLVALVGWYWRALLRQVAEVRASHPGEVEQTARTWQIARAVVRARATEWTPALAATATVAAFGLGCLAVAGAWASGQPPGEAAAAAPDPLAATARGCSALGSWLAGAAMLGLVAVGRSAYRDRASRRTVGILWDVGTFWPRAAHPFAPPCYAERAVPDLTWRAVTWTSGHPGRALVLSGHSQGSVLAAAAAWQLDPTTRSRTALLTYGSPLARLYGRWFPAYLGPRALARLDRELPAWTNLWRRTDPIGGPVDVTPPAPRPPVDVGPLPDPASYGRTRAHPLPTPILGHGGYPDDPAFPAARADLLERLDGTAAHPTVPGPTTAAEADDTGR